MEKNKMAFKTDKTKDGWTLFSTTPNTKKFSAKELELVSLLGKGESHIAGEEMMKRSKSLKANLNQHHAEYLLEHQDEIPKEWRSYSLVFSGTVWRGSYGDRRVACLYWGGKRWILYFYWLAIGWRSDDRLVRPRRTASALEPLATSVPETIEVEVKVGKNRYEGFANRVR